MIKMTAKKATRYAGKAIAVGDEFSVKSNAHAKLYQAIGKATIVPVDPPLIRKKEVEPEEPKRTYKRKDMVAEEPEGLLTKAVKTLKKKAKAA